MSQLVKMRGLQIAEKVYSEMERMIDSMNDYVVRAYGFANGTSTGYHFTCDNGRSCTVINTPTTDNIRVVYGRVEEFDHSTYKTVSDDVRYIDLDHRGAYAAAVVVLRWLIEGHGPAA